MKKSFRIILALSILVAISFASCKKEEIETPKDTLTDTVYVVIDTIPYCYGGWYGKWELTITRQHFFLNTYNDTVPEYVEVVENSMIEGCDIEIFETYSIYPYWEDDTLSNNSDIYTMFWKYECELILQE